MSDAPIGGGWRPMARPQRPADASAFVTSPFTRLARVQAVQTAGDALVALALVDSVFFAVDTSEARWRVAFYLLLTAAPFAVVAPFVGPAIDRLRGGQRLVVLASVAVRAIAAFVMIGQFDRLALYPLAFAHLVSGKSYIVAKSALVPTVVRSDDELVEANAKLGMISAILAFVAVLPGLVLRLGGPGLVLAGAGVLFVVATLLALQLPRTQVAAAPATQTERAELHGAGIVLAASAMALLRLATGFLLFHVAFAFRSDGVATVWYGVVLAFYGMGSLAGVATAPVLRRAAREEVMLVVSIAAGTLAALVSWLWGGRPAAAMLGLVIGASAAAGKQAFDAIVQRDAPEANRGRAFARFETKFQLAWVLGALLPVVLPLPLWWGYVALAAITVASAATYVAGLRTVRRTGALPPPLAARLRNGGQAAVRRLRPGAREPLAPPPPRSAGPPGRRRPAPAPGRNDGPVQPARSPFLPPRARRDEGEDRRR